MNNDPIQKIIEDYDKTIINFSHFPRLKQMIDKFYQLLSLEKEI